MNEFRLIIDPPMNAAVNMARDLAILEMQSLKNPVPTLRIYRWSYPSVTIGYFQKLDDSVNLEYCHKNGISVTRRVTGGGTVLHHKELTYSFTLPVKKKIVPESVEDSFRYIIAPLIDSIKSLSLDAEYRPVNDIIINNKKISGSAQVRKKGILQQHGTLLIDIDKQLLYSAIKINVDKLKSKGFKTPADSITSLCGELNNKADDEFTDDLIVKLISSFSESMHIKFLLGDLSMAESAIMNSYISKFNNKQWNDSK
ncbi:MAG TPA: lipoate--protein ligase family protein [Spirochaetota bacterium]|nr:lipoate--protein ligase family protein [Spirochaetota bacterium]HPF04485.1 lipoate--protein ligase family protein [Spirochaetota bacterium]HPJ40743.1 lipoate--protein ligase family protein [Spirochaetota bacterium]HPR36012.1 lipoate--protein ligase family protein [Spirochaetota bacterium]HRX45926.1 lipoate--protein ligase family protein [Spirochaetota bacterium]